MKNVKKIILVLIVVIVLFLAALTLYKFTYITEEKNEEVFTAITIGDEKKQIVQNAISDKEKYTDKVIGKSVLSYDYEIVNNGDGIYGKIYINSDKKIYITDNNKVVKVSDVEFKTLYRDNNHNYGLILYAISLDGKVYAISLMGLDIKKVNIDEIVTDFNALNFTSLKFNNEFEIPGGSIIILANDDNLYDIFTGIHYEDTITQFEQIYYVYSDKTIANHYGVLLKDEEGNYYKIKYYIPFLKLNDLFKDANSIIITENNKIICTNDYGRNINEYNKTIKSIDYKMSDNGVSVTVNIEFTDNQIIIIDGLNSKYFGFK